MNRVGARLHRGKILLAAGLLVGCGEEFIPPAAPPADDDPCNGPGALADRFDDGELSDTFISHVSGEGMVIEESGGALVFTPTEVGGNGSRDARYAIDLRGSAVVAEVPAIEGGLLGKTVSLGVERDGGMFVTMTASEDQQNEGEELLRFQVTSSEGNTSDSTAYDPVAQRWWRFGDLAGVLSFSTSPDGVEWTTHHEVSTPSFVEASYLSLSTSDSAEVLPIGPIRFDNLNPQGGSFCGVDRLVEPFDRPLGEGWVAYQDNNCVGTVAGGTLQASVPAGGYGQCAYTTRHGYDLRGRALTVAFGALPAAASGTGVELTLSSGDDDWLRMEHRQDMLDVSSQLGAATSNGSTELGAGPSWWRVREADGTLEFEVSADGASFESVRSVIVDYLPPRFLVSLRVYVNEVQPADTSLVIDAIN